MFRHLRPLILAPLLFASVAQAAPIVFTHIGTGQGTLDGVPFGPSRFVVTAVGDTDDRSTILNGWQIPHLAVVVEIQGVQSVELSTETRSWVNQMSGLIGFGRVGSGDLYSGPSHSVFDTWSMTTPVGPIQGTGRLLQWGLGAVQTTGGVLFFEDGTESTTFRSLTGLFSDGFETGDVSAWAPGEPTRMTLQEGQGYDFSEQTAGSLSHGDFYFLNQAGANKFWANNAGMRGVLDLGAGIGGFETVVPPDSGYVIGGVLAVAGHTYVARAEVGEDDVYIVFRVVEVDDTEVTMDFVLMYRPFRP